jgi:hypothetical protein
LLLSPFFLRCFADDETAVVRSGGRQGRWRNHVCMATGFGEVRAEMALLRADNIERSHDLLKWMLAFGVAQTAALAGLLNLWR